VAAYGWPPMINRDLRTHLRDVAENYLLETLGRPERAARKKWIAHEWGRVAKLSADLTRTLSGISRAVDRPPDPDDPDGLRLPVPDYSKHMFALLELQLLARSHLAKPERRNDDLGFPKARARDWFHFKVLEVWTDLGGELRKTRHPTTGKIKGPLARYFFAATRPVHGGSLESLPDILARQKSLITALHEWRLKMAEAEG
jgi:hypothetical protein